MTTEQKNNQITNNNQSVVIQEQLQKEIGERIKQASKKVGGQKILSDMTGISESQIARYVKGSSEQSAVKLISIAHATQVSLDWLLTGSTPDGNKIKEEKTDAYIKSSSSRTLLDKYNKIDKNLRLVCDQVGFTPSLYMQDMIKTMMFSGHLTDEGLIVLIKALKADYDLLNPVPNDQTK